MYIGLFWYTSTAWDRRLSKDGSLPNIWASFGIHIDLFYNVNRSLFLEMHWSESQKTSSLLNWWDSCHFISVSLRVYIGLFVYVYRSLLVYNNCMKQMFLQNECPHYICSCHSRISRNRVYIPNETYVSAKRGPWVICSCHSRISNGSCTWLIRLIHVMSTHPTRHAWVVVYQKRPIYIPKETYMLYTKRDLYATRHEWGTCSTHSRGHAEWVGHDMNETFSMCHDSFNEGHDSWDRCVCRMNALITYAVACVYRSLCVCI